MTGDVPQGQNFSDFIDSYVNIVETGVQTMAGALNATEIITPHISAATALFTNAVQIQFNTSIARLWVSTSVHTSAIDMRNGVISNIQIAQFTNGIVSAAGTTQATAAPLIYSVNLGRGVTDGTTTGFLLIPNTPGRVQYLINGVASANLWPVAGGQINALSSNAAFGMAANTLYTIIHTLASGYAVK